MNTKVIGVLGFIFGFAAGGVIGFKYSESKKAAECDSCREARRKNDENKKGKEKTGEPHKIVGEKPDISEYAEKVNLYNKPKAEPKKQKMNAPEIISPEEFGEDEDYEVISLSYYQNDILTDDLNEPMDDEEVTSAIGDIDFDSEFGRYEDDSVFVRNDERKCYYEILHREEVYSEEQAGDGGN